MTAARSPALLSLLAAALLTPAAACASDGDTVRATLKDASGRTSGTVTLKAAGDHLAGQIEASGLTPGEHGMHIHAVGKCEAPAFTSAGGHLNPGSKQHGLQNPQGAHQGDLTALTVKADGTARQEFHASSSIGSILDDDGGAFIVHAAPDDQKTDPTGNSGDRILCGVFEAG